MVVLGQKLVIGRLEVFEAHHHVVAKHALHSENEAECPYEVNSDYRYEGS